MAARRQPPTAMHQLSRGAPPPPSCAQVITPLALRAQRQIKEVPAPVPGSSQHAWGQQRAWEARAGGALQAPTCGDLAGELPAERLSGGEPPPPLRADGGRLADAGGGATVTLRGLAWRGFDLGQTFVALPGLRATDGSSGGGGAGANASWAAADFAAAAATLRLLGFNTVGLPLTFDDLAAAPLDVTAACPGARPSAADLAARAVPPGAALGPGLPPPPRPYAPPGGGNGSSADAPGTCNAYVPRGPTTLARLLWATDFLVRSGLYVVLQYAPPGADAGGGGGAPPLPPALTDPAAFAAAWQRLGAALECLPGWADKLAGRVLLDLLSAPGAAGLTWNGTDGGSGGGGERPPLGEFYLAAMDALDGVEGGGGGGAAAPAHALRPLLLVAGDGGGAAAGPERARALGAGDASAFLRVLSRRPYAGRVALAPRLDAAPAGGNATAAGEGLWRAMEAGWCAGARGPAGRRAQLLEQRGRRSQPCPSPRPHHPVLPTPGACSRPTAFARPPPPTPRARRRAAGFPHSRGAWAAAWTTARRPPG
jgi:hypothetical protein